MPGALRFGCREPGTIRQKQERRFLDGRMEEGISLCNTETDAQHLIVCDFFSDGAVSSGGPCDT